MIGRQINNDEFWITNISKRIVHLSDINVVIYPFRSLNLLDKKHNSLNKEQLEKSANSGSLFIKRKMVVVRKIAPEIEGRKRPLMQEGATITKQKRSLVELENIKYEELELSDDAYAEENADLAELDYAGKYKK